MLDLDELAIRARDHLPEHVAGYFAGPPTRPGASSDEAAWSALRFRPRVLVDTASLELGTTVLCTPVRTPLLVAPVAQQSAAHPDGERATATAVARVGGLLGVSTNTAVPFVDLAAAGAPWWFQVYVWPDRDATAELVLQAAAAGAKALILTADLPVVDPRRPEFEPRRWPDHYGMLANLPLGRIEELGLANLRGARNLTPEVIGWLARLSGLPIVVKGVLRGDDAVRCVEAGAAAVIVSSHGGRRLAQSVSPAQALPEVVAAVAGRAEVFVDSGLRSAEHVAAALCLGARAVFVGRPVLWALAAGGADLVAELLTGWTDELAVVMQQLGARRLAELTPDLVA